MMESSCVTGIIIGVYGREANRDKPVVFVTHGRGGRASDMDRLCRKLVEAGLIAVTLDHRNHGTRISDRKANGYGPSHASDMYGIIVGTAMDISILVDFLPAQLGIGTSRCGVTGESLGGHASIMAMGLDARIGACAALIGSGDYEALMRSRHAFPEFSSMTFENFYPPDLAACVARYDPVRRAESFADRPLLMLNGEADTLVPIACNDKLVEALRPAYAHPERLRLQRYPTLDHRTTPAMEDEAVEWLARWL